MKNSDNIDVYEAQKIGTHGYIRLLDVMGSDDDIVYSARMSYDGSGRSSARKLIRRMMRKGHTSPFEMGELRFEVKAPIFVARQWLRHRTANVNELSGRFAVVKPEFYEPPEGGWRKQSSTNKQASSDEALGRSDDNLMCFEYRNSNSNAYDKYLRAIRKGVSRELARAVLPVATYTKFVWKCDLSNILHFMKLRCDREHAQPEIADYADAISKIVEALFPLTYEAWCDYQRDSITLSRLDLDAIAQLGLRATRVNSKSVFDSENEHDEFVKKLNRLGVAGKELRNGLLEIRAWVTDQMSKYPHGEPDSATIAMFAGGFARCLALSNARPREYANDPWKSQAFSEHLDHAIAHLANVKSQLESKDGYVEETDLGFSDLVHCAVRALMAEYIGRNSGIL